MSAGCKQKFYREDKMPIREKDTSELTDLVRRACRRSVQATGKHDCLKDCSHYLKRLPSLTIVALTTRPANHKIKSTRH